MANKLKNLKNEITPKTRKGLILTIIFGVLVPIGGGIGAGIVINKYFIGKKTDYSKIDESEIKNVDNIEALMQKYQAGLTNYEEIYQPWDIFNVSFNLFSQHEYNSSITIGNADAGIVQQSIRNCTIRNGKRYFEESISKSSFVSLGNRTYVNEDESIYLYKGTAEASDIATYQPEHYEFNADEFTTMYGKTPVRPTIYVVNSKTAIKKASSTTKTATGYTVNLSLNPTTSVIDYIKQMKNISNLSDYPSFYYVKLTLNTDENLLVKTMHIEEQYFAKMGGIGTDITANIDITYKVDEKVMIPTIEESINYKEVE